MTEDPARLESIQRSMLAFAKAVYERGHWYWEQDEAYDMPVLMLDMAGIQHGMVIEPHDEDFLTKVSVQQNYIHICVDIWNNIYRSEKEAASE